MVHWLRGRLHTILFWKLNQRLCILASFTLKLRVFDHESKDWSYIFFLLPFAHPCTHINIHSTSVVWAHFICLTPIWGAQLSAFLKGTLTLKWDSKPSSLTLRPQHFTISRVNRWTEWWGWWWPAVWK